MGTLGILSETAEKQRRCLRLDLPLGVKDEDIECTVEFVEKKGGIEPAVKSVT